jgi:hypothetical protein
MQEQGRTAVPQPCSILHLCIFERYANFSTFLMVLRLFARSNEKEKVAP